MGFYVYMVKCSNGAYYTGWTTDYINRVKEHNEGPHGAKYTKAHGPVSLAYLEGFDTKKEALKREAEIKKKCTSAMKHEMAEAYNDPVKFYQDNVYGQIRSGEKVSCKISECKRLLDNLSGPMLRFFKEPDIAAEKKTVEMTLQNGNAKTSMKYTLYLPKKDQIKEGGAPVIICMHAIEPIQYAVDNGYAVAVMDANSVATDDTKHEGCFYDLYPYGDEPSSQTGVLAAWAWGCSKILDSLYEGVGKELNINPEMSIVTGVSRWGKATAVAGLFDSRFKMVVPTCSGAGGLALYSFKSEGKQYDFRDLGIDKPYKYEQNEPLSCLQSDAERGWFNDAFLKYKKDENISADQFLLLSGAVNKDRLYLVIGACTGEDWVNSPSMNECFKRASHIVNERGLSQNLKAHFHKVGHAVILEDMEFIIAWFNEVFYNIKSPIPLESNNPFKRYYPYNETGKTEGKRKYRRHV